MCSTTHRAMKRGKLCYKACMNRNNVAEREWPFDGSSSVKLTGDAESMAIFNKAGIKQIVG